MSTEPRRGARRKKRVDDEHPENGPSTRVRAAPGPGDTDEELPEHDPSEDTVVDPQRPALPDDLDDDVEDEPTFPGIDTAVRPGLSQARPSSVSEAHLKSVLESLIFVSDAPVSAKRLARVTRARTKDIEHLLVELCDEYTGRGIELAQIAGGYQFRSTAANAPFVREIVQRRPVRLTRAQLEALAIAAYRQPLTRPELEEIRGVDSGSALKVLLERGLLKILGRKDEPGRPLLYGTTPYFLEFFGMSTLDELPTLKEFAELSDESRALFARRTGEEIETIGDIEVPEREWAEDDIEESEAEAREEGHAAVEPDPQDPPVDVASAVLALEDDDEEEEKEEDSLQEDELEELADEDEEEDEEEDDVEDEDEDEDEDEAEEAEAAVDDDE